MDLPPCAVELSGMRFLRRITAVPAWKLFLANMMALTALFLLLPRASKPGAVIYIGAAVAEFIAVFIGIRRYRPARAHAWHLLLCGVGLYALANSVWAGWPILLHRDLPFPSVADGLYVLAYLCFVVGLAVLIRERGGWSQSAGALVDAGIVTAAAGILSWEYLIEPVGIAAHATTLVRLVSAAYPLLDLAIVALAVVVLFTRGPRSPAFLLVCGFVLAQLVADSIYLNTVLHGTFSFGNPLMVGWLLSFGCLGAAALHPSMASLAESLGTAHTSRMPRSRLVFLAMAAITVPAVQLLPGHAKSQPDVLVSTAAIFLLCICRMAVLVRALDREANTLQRRERELRSTVSLLNDSEAHLAHAAHHDALTGLANRALFTERLEGALAAANQSVGVMLLDVDRFKTVNDSLGHAVGDALLVAMGGRLAAAVRSGDTVARLGGDEFTVLAQDLDEQGMRRLAARLLRTLDAPFGLIGRQVSVRASLGMALRRAGSPIRELLRDADAAMYEAKRKGGQRYAIFNDGMHARVLDRLELEGDLRAAELGTAITLHYQPLIDLGDGQITGFEALLRWQDPERGMVPPATFIPVAEEMGLIVPMGLWVLQEACRHAVAWREMHAGRPPLGMSVNVSAVQLGTAHFFDDVARTLEETRLDPALLTLEITETMMMADEDDVRDQLLRLKDLGLRISLDDFGTGYSSLGHLQRFPIDELKIDGSFVATLGAGPEGSQVASAVIRLARSLQIEVVAEGIETNAQLDELRRSSCTRGQGYYFWKPMDAAAVVTLLDDLHGDALPPIALPTVMVVDDDATFRSTVGRILSGAGFDTVEVGTGQAALDLASCSQLDAVLLDIELPDLDGLSVCQSLRERAPDGLTVVQVSGSAVGLAERVRGLESGADAYLTKPVAPAELVATLRSTMRARSNDCVRV
jgi:diguanylate cyclase